MKKILGISVFILLSLFSQAQTKLDVDAFEKKIKEKGVQLVDVRTPAEVANGKIKGATTININDADFKDKISKLDKNKPVAVYCGVGGRSGRASTMLTQLGFKQVFDLAGGMTAWNAQGKPVEKPQR
jgi:rhodanese-related sulfurtransferase